MEAFSASNQQSITKKMVSVWWSIVSVVHYNFMRPNSWITAEICLNQLDKMMPKFEEKISLQENARPYTTQTTVAKLEELKLLHHLPYPSDPATTCNCNFDNFFIGKKFNFPIMQLKWPSRSS